MALTAPGAITLSSGTGTFSVSVTVSGYGTIPQGSLIKLVVGSGANETVVAYRGIASPDPNGTVSISVSRATLLSDLNGNELKWRTKFIPGDDYSSWSTITINALPTTVSVSNYNLDDGGNLSVSWTKPWAHAGMRYSVSVYVNDVFILSRVGFTGAGMSYTPNTTEKNAMISAMDGASPKTLQARVKLGWNGAGYYSKTKNGSANITKSFDSPSGFTSVGTVTGSPITITIQPYKETYRHDLSYRIGTGTWVLFGDKVATTANFTISTENSAYAETYTNPVEIAMQTYSGTTKIGGEVKKTVNVTVPNNVRPTFDYSASEQNALVTALGLDPQTYVANNSQIAVAITNAMAGLGSSLPASPYQIKLADGTIAHDSGTFALQNISGNLDIDFIVTDKRGINRSKTQSQAITILPYAKPSFIKVPLFYRSTDGQIDPKGLNITVNFKALATSLKNGSTEKNSLEVKIYIKKPSDVDWGIAKYLSGKQGVSFDNVYTSTGNQYEAIQDYVIKFELIDELTTVVIASADFYIPIAGVNLFVGSRGVATSVGRIPEFGDKYNLEVDEKGIYSKGGFFNENEKPAFIKELIYIPANSDLNDYMTPGWYSTGTSVNTKTLSNAPNGYASLLEVLPSYQEDYAIQRITNYNTKNVFYRTYYEGAWYDWKKMD